MLNSTGEIIICCRGSIYRTLRMAKNNILVLGKDVMNHAPTVKSILRSIYRRLLSNNVLTDLGYYSRVLTHGEMGIMLEVNGE